MTPDPAPLWLDPAAPIGAASWTVGHGGARLRLALFQSPHRVPRGSVVVSPGRGEQIEKYAEVVGDLIARDFVVLIHDWRGQGLSQRLHRDPRAGHANGAAEFLADYRHVLDAATDVLPRPWIALAHSMGGGLATLALTEGEDRFDAAVLSAPMLAIKTASWSPWQLRLIAGLMGRLGRGGDILPVDVRDPLDFHENGLTHDEARWRRGAAIVAAHPELDLTAVTWGWLRFALELSSRIARPGAMERVTIPYTVVAAGDERLCVNAAMQAAVRRAPQGRYLEVPDAWHELLIETDPVREVFWRAFDATVAQIA